MPFSYSPPTSTHTIQPRQSTQEPSSKNSVQASSPTASRLQLRRPQSTKTISLRLVAGKQRRPSGWRECQSRGCRVWSLRYGVGSTFCFVRQSSLDRFAGMNKKTRECSAAIEKDRIQESSYYPNNSLLRRPARSCDPLVSLTHKHR